MTTNERWIGVRAEAQGALETRDYHKPALANRLGTSGVEAREIRGPEVQAGLRSVWIPGVEVFGRRVFSQPSRGFFGEFARQTDGILAQIGLWPRQWAAARMFAGTAKGFHIHPPHIPAGEVATTWFPKLFASENKNLALRPYAQEQWDVMFFLQGIAEMLLVDERPGMERRVMRFSIWGDDLPSESNVGVVIPAGVAHAIRSASSTDLLMVYGTSTTFIPENEGRLASGVEQAPLPQEWQDYVRG
jgi:dTDP-4-dehydrorhamnose 3,5-epimerase-like enzyme